MMAVGVEQAQMGCDPPEVMYWLESEMGFVLRNMMLAFVLTEVRNMVMRRRSLEVKMQGKRC